MIHGNIVAARSEVNNVGFSFLKGRGKSYQNDIGDVTSDGLYLKNVQRIRCAFPREYMRRIDIVRQLAHVRGYVRRARFHYYRIRVTYLLNSFNSVINPVVNAT